MRILITGGAGRLGRQLAAMLAGQGHRIRAFDLPFVSFDGLEAYEIVKGDITDQATVNEAVRGTNLVAHLAALLPPASERDRAKTFAVNVEGTRLLAQAAAQQGAQMVFSSSVVTYGDTSASSPPIRIDHPLRPLDIYGESKVAAEEVERDSGAPYTTLRISGISVPAFLEPPSPWPFTAEQRMEFVSLSDVALAVVEAVNNPAARGKTLNVAGGPTWQLRGKDYVARYYEVMDIPFEEARFLEQVHEFDWYDTTEAEALLHFQRTSFPQFLEQLRQAVEEAIG